MDTAGNVSAASTALSVTVDTTAPAAPTFTGATASTLAGKGEAGATVTVKDGTATIGTATVGGAGNWSMSFTASASARSLTAVQTDKAGNQSPSGGLALLGRGGADTLTSSTGNDILFGGAGADIFSFASTFGNDIIADFAATGSAHDTIKFVGNSVLNNFANVMSHASQVGSAVVITQDSSNTLTLNNVSKTSLTSADFSFA